MENKKAIKYLVLLIVCLLLMFLGSVLVLFIAVAPLKSISGYSGETITEALTVFQNYFSIKDYNGTLTWAEYGESYFDNDPVLFKNIKTFYCAIQFISYMPLLIVIVFFLREEFAEDFKDFKKNFKKNIILIVCGFGAMLLIASAVNTIYEVLKITGDSANEATINLLLDSPGMILMVIAVVILAPITEEVIFRKLLMGTCETTFKFPPVVAIIISSLVFSFIHVSDLESLKFIFQYLALAVPICVVYHLSKNNIFVTICVHVLNNFLSVVLTLWMLGR